MRKSLFPSLVLLVFFTTSFAGWEHNYGGSGSEYGMSVAPALDGGYVVAGYTNGYGAESFDLYLLKVDSAGAFVWRKVLGGAYADNGYSICETSDSGFVVAGSYGGSGDSGDSHIWILKINSEGDTLWSKISGLGTVGYSIQQTTDGGYILVCNIYYSGYYEVLLLKLDSVGDTIWSRHFVGRGYGYSVEQTSDGGYIITGKRKFGEDYDIWLIKTDSEGWEEWTRTYGDTTTNEYGKCVKQTYDGGYIIAGGGGSDGWVIKTNSFGDTLWTKRYGGSGEDELSSVVQLDDGGYIFVGKTNSFGFGGYDLWVIRADSLGDTVFTKTFGGPEDDGGTCIRRTYDGNFIISGFTSSFGAGYDVYLIKMDESGNTSWIKETSQEPRNISVNSYPNPFNSSCVITAPAGARVEIYDLQGRIVYTSPSAGTKNGKHIWSPNQSVPSSVYLIRAITEDGQVAQKKVVLIR